MIDTCSVMLVKLSVVPNTRDICVVQEVAGSMAQAQKMLKTKQKPSN